jgi:DNA polymerase-3 subunit alpha
LRLLDCIIKPADLIDRAYELGLSGIAITDHESLSAHIEAIQHYKKKYINTDFKLILGNEIYLVDERGMGGKYPHFLLLAKNAEGHKALRELSSIAWSNSYYDRGLERVPVTKNELLGITKKFPNTLIATTACIGGELAQDILRLNWLEDRNMLLVNEEEIQKYKEKIFSFIGFLKECFGDDLYLEIAPNTSDEQRTVNNRMVSISKYFDIPMLFATDSHYLNKEDRYIHKAFLNSKGGEREVDDFYSSAYMMSEDEVWEYLSRDFSRQEFLEMIAVSKSILNKIEFYDLYNPQVIPTIQVPQIKLQNQIDNKYTYLTKMLSDSNIQNNNWVSTCLNKLKEKNLFNDIYLQRLDDEAKELWEISEKLQITMTSYYNTMAKIIDIVWNEGDSLVGVARGSATGFLSCYLLGITQLDPLKWNLPHWRHLTSTRPEFPDIDFDTQALRRDQILQAIKNYFGHNNVLNICTFGTEGPKSAILTACRGLGIEHDIGLYLTGMIPQERGFTWPLSDCLYGNEEKDRRPIEQLKIEMEKYEGLEEMVLKIEGLVNKRSIHAAGVYIFNDGFVERNALMKAPNGQPVTQWDMNDSDYMGCLKYDLLTIEALDKIRVALDLLIEDGLIERQKSLKETYDKYIHPDVLDYSEATWGPASNGEVINLFQFDTLVGGQAVKKVQPKSLEDAASANSLMRLMPLDDGTVLVDKYVQFKNNIQYWYSELHINGIRADEVRLLEPHYLPVHGVPNTQEDMMEILMNPELIGFTLEEANYARKIVGKKKMEDIPKLRKMIFDKSKVSQNLINYIYSTAIQPQLGYSFSRNHTTPYTAIALQELNIYNKYPSLYWNTACLYVNAGATEDKTTDYAKIATAIGQIKSSGINVALPDINRSKFNFNPDIENDRILCGLKGLVNIGDEVVSQIIKNRPYTSMTDFLKKNNASKSAMISLIKSGAFDNIEKIPREQIMENYLYSTLPERTRISLQTIPAIINSSIDKTEIQRELRIYEFNRYLKTLKKGQHYILDERAMEFFLDSFDPKLIDDNEGIKCTLWDKLYDKQMDSLRKWLSDNQNQIKRALNEEAFKEEWEKYAQGTIASWEMDSVSFYHSFHELEKVNTSDYGIVDFYKLPEYPKVEKFINFGPTKKIPIFETSVIAGTILGKDKIKSTISIQTIDGVVYVKFRPEQFAEYDKQISERQTDGTKRVLDRSWFNRGKKILLTGFRRGSEFVPKKYSHTPTEMLYLIDNIDTDGNLVLKRDR